MKTTLPVLLSPDQLPALAELDDSLRKYLANNLSLATRRAYAADWRRFDAWARAVGRPALPATPETVALFLVWEVDAAGTHPNTLGRRLAAIRMAHQAADVPDEALPTDDKLVRAAHSGIRKTHGVAVSKKTPALAEDVKKMADQAMADSTNDATTHLKGLRDRALVLLGFAGAFRRSELVALTIKDLEPPGEDGMIVHVGRSKTDQEGRGTTKPIYFGEDARYCPIHAVNAWREAANLRSGPLFPRVYKGNRRVGNKALTPYSAVLVIKTLALAAGLDPACYAGHSLRSGFLTSASRAGASLDKLRDVSGHKTLQVLLEYINDADQFKNHAGKGLL